MDNKQIIGVRTTVDVREHVGYFGSSLTGKTTLARHHARILSSANYDVAVYDPVRTSTAGGDWPKEATLIETEEVFDKFIEKAHGDPKRPMFLFVDESADLFGHTKTWNHWIPRRIRHNDIYLRLIVQRPKMVHPDVRSQCTHGYLLRMANDDMRMVLADFGHGGEAVESPLDKGDCLMVVSGSADIERFNVFEHLDRRKN